HAHRGHVDRAARCLDAADRGLAGSKTTEANTAAAARALLVRAATDAPTPAAMRRAAERALRQLSSDDTWWPYRLLLQGCPSLLLHETDRADDLFRRAVHCAERVGATETKALALAQRAVLADARGEHSAADAHLNRIRASDDHLTGFASYALALAA